MRMRVELTHDDGRIEILQHVALTGNRISIRFPVPILLDAGLGEYLLGWDVNLLVATKTNEAAWEAMLEALDQLNGGRP